MQDGKSSMHDSSSKRAFNQFDGVVFSMKQPIHDITEILYLIEIHHH
jgi:hypothetical protein